ncbi:hypothetical protein [Streptomyces sp. NPDC058475]|uniref:hypothetical protein n=1 Tax=Streptomyces sp. NPDC058475 TaxID=3346518 RepID=UPI00365E5E1A
MVDAALAQIPDAYRHGTPILIRADSAGSAKAFLTHIRSLHKAGALGSVLLQCRMPDLRGQGADRLADRRGDGVSDREGRLDTVRIHLRIADTWPWRHELADAFTRLAAPPRLAT